MDSGKNSLVAFGAPIGVDILQEIPHQAAISEVLATTQMLNQKWESGTMVTNPISGLPGDRSRVTLGEVSIKRTESLSVFDSIGYDLELGAIHAILAAYETLMLNWTELSTPVSGIGHGGEGFRIRKITERNAKGIPKKEPQYQRGWNISTDTGSREYATAS